jgi:4a-hydroxytetrahydrobiopterin dehydratase|tara:strand:+ start:1476 stop:1763 length:288 start_codon:yes stop_codon:yes gene_type:complete
MTKALSDRTELQSLFNANWSLIDNRDAISKEFKFKSFQKAWGWMTEIALCAEKLDHHPEWSNTYNRVQVVLTTHSCDGLSDLDIKLAKLMDEAAN